MSEDTQARFDVRTTSDSHFAWVRTRLSMERTLMAWVRTATALIGFGFTIVQFFQRLQTMEGVEPARHPEAARYLGLALIGAGVVSLAISAWQYHRLNKYMWGPPFTPLAGFGKGPQATPLLSVAIGLMLIGLFAFFAVLLRFV
jgi:putative membrane protein